MYSVHMGRKLCWSLSRLEWTAPVSAPVTIEASVITFQEIPSVHSPESLKSGHPEPVCSIIAQKVMNI